jgi:hypothetical protein
VDFWQPTTIWEYITDVTVVQYGEGKGVDFLEEGLVGRHEEEEVVFLQEVVVGGHDEEVFFELVCLGQGLEMKIEIEVLRHGVVEFL